MKHRVLNIDPNVAELWKRVFQVKRFGPEDLTLFDALSTSRSEVVLVVTGMADQYFQWLECRRLKKNQENEKLRFVRCAEAKHFMNLANPIVVRTGTYWTRDDDWQIEQALYTRKARVFDDPY